MKKGDVSGILKQNPGPKICFIWKVSSVKNNMKISRKFRKAYLIKNELQTIQ